MSFDGTTRTDCCTVVSRPPPCGRHGYNVPGWKLGVVVQSNSCLSSSASENRRDKGSKSGVKHPLLFLDPLSSVALI